MQGQVDADKSRTHVKGKKKRCIGVRISERKSEEMLTVVDKTYSDLSIPHLSEAIIEQWNIYRWK